MSPDLNAHATTVLGNLSAALQRFATEALQSLDATTQDANRAIDRLAVRRHHWQDMVRRYQERISGLEAALLAPRATTYYDPQTGTAYVPKPSVYETTLAESQRRLRIAEAALHDVEESIQSVQQAAAAFQLEAQRLVRWLEADLPQAAALLGGSNTPPQHVVGPIARLIARWSTGSGFDAAWKHLNQRWMEAQAVWDGPARRRFEDEYWIRLAQQVDATLHERQHLAQVLSQAERGVL